MHTLVIEGHIKPGKKTEFLTAWKKEALPALKKQQGFVDEILLFGTTEQDSGMGLSFWKTREEAERYQSSTFPKVSSALQHLMNGAPTVRSYNVEVSETFRIAAEKAA
ncbi:MAG TPA: antibiotic biosynthesis monooxygenase [Granulicella sp.]|jgi:heme-degrading monooxygenase HmoA|nr:antibiotic biosynthesis monooxygenase [Granulicella sp.]